MASGGGDQQQHQADLNKPEAIWLDYIRENYPNLEQHTYFYPPLYFNLVRFAVDEVAGQRVNVTDPNHVPRAPLTPPPVPKKKARTQPSTSSASAGTPSSASSSTRQPPGIFIENPPDLRPPRVNENDQRGDQAQCECVSFLKSISPEEPMVVISQLDFQNYLNVKANPNDEDVIQQLPGLPSDCPGGDWDVLIIHRHFGLIMGEVKAVGGSAEHPNTRIIQKRVRKALKQLKKQHEALADLTPSGDSGIRITRMLMLPNLTYDQLNAALTNFQQHELRQTLSNSDDPIQTRKHVLCQDDLPRAIQWWRDLHRQETDPSMTFDIYERMVARFCGRATTVRIPVACTLHRSVLRTKAEAVDETSLRYSFLTLTSTQVTLLCEKPDQRRIVYCQGPPGCGKSVVLLLKAVQWVQKEKNVVIISQPSGSAAVSMLIKHQLTKLVGQTAAAKYIRVHAIDFDDSLNVHDDVERLWNDHGLDCAILCDEVPIRNATKFAPWLTEVHRTSPQNQPMVWMAGVWTRDSRDGSVNALLHLPPCVEVSPMHDPLRCPLAITKAVLESRLISQFIGQYNMSTLPMHTEGFPVQRLKHFEEPGHCTEKDPLQCNQCTDAVAEILKSLGVGERGPLQYRDVVILTNGYHESNEPPMVQRLREIHEMPVASIRGTMLGEADALKLALADENQIIETHFHMVRGLERPVVVSVATRLQDYEFESISRSTCVLICID